MSVGVMPGRGGHTPGTWRFGHAAGVSPGPRRGCAGCVRWAHVSGRHVIGVAGLPGRWCGAPWGEPVVLPRRGVLVACGLWDSRRAVMAAGVVLARVRGGQPWLVTIEGESGAGKTALARRALAEAGLAAGGRGGIRPRPIWSTGSSGSWWPGRGGRRWPGTCCWPGRRRGRRRSRSGRSCWGWSVTGWAAGR